MFAAGLYAIDFVITLSAKSMDSPNFIPFALDCSNHPDKVEAA